MAHVFPCSSKQGQKSANGTMGLNLSTSKQTGNVGGLWVLLNEFIELLLLNQWSFRENTTSWYCNKILLNLADRGKGLNLPL